MIGKIFQPAIFQGHLKKKRYFEGWYFKLVSENGDRFAIIPGIALAEKDHKNNHAFVQIIDGVTTKTYYIRYRIDEFSASKSKFEVRLGNNYFSEEEIILDINHDDLQIKGKVRFVDKQPIPTSISSPGIMGWYSFVPFMECYHGIISMNHKLSGHLSINNKTTDLENGKGFIEKDWGRSFPKAWIWIQSNHFTTQNASIMLSVADIPWLGNFFIGFLCVLWIDGKFYKFATYTGAKISEIIYKEGKTSIIIENKEYQLKLTTSESKSGELMAPEIGRMDRVIKESLDAEVNVILSDKKDGRILFKDTGKYAGYELVGNINHLINNIK